MCVYQHLASIESEDEISVQSERLYNVESCSDYFYEQASQVIWHSVTTVEGVNEFLNSYNPWEDNEYKKSFWNYYFWWNNVWLSYPELNIHDWDINTDNESRYWSNYNDETWWEEWSSMVNPCDENNWEYLPTADEWYELIGLWADISDIVLMSIEIWWIEVFNLDKICCYQTREGCFFILDLGEHL